MARAIHPPSKPMLATEVNKMICPPRKEPKPIPRLKIPEKMLIKIKNTFPTKRARLETDKKTQIIEETEGFFVLELEKGNAKITG